MRERPTASLPPPAAAAPPASWTLPSISPAVSFAFSKVPFSFVQLWAAAMGRRSQI